VANWKMEGPGVIEFKNGWMEMSSWMEKINSNSFPHCYFFSEVAFLQSNKVNFLIITTSIGNKLLEVTSNIFLKIKE